jgi:hypothetical protein
VYERTGKSEGRLEWQRQNIIRGSGLPVEKPERLRGKRVRLMDASGRAAYGGKGSDRPPVALRGGTFQAGSGGDAPERHKAGGAGGRL